MNGRKSTQIASGRVEDLLDAIARPHTEHDLQGQTAANFDMSVRDEMQGQQERRPMPEQERYIPEPARRPDIRGVSPEPAGGLPRQVPDAGQDELIPSIVPSAPPGSRKP
jgi:hypothetical protein